jgi:hypothetical protein
MSLTISNIRNESFQLSPHESLQLELQLNLTRFGHQWIDIGNTLFEFANTQESTSLLVTIYQYEFLNKLYKKYLLK